MIELKGITFSYEDTLVLNDLSIKLESKRINCLLGPSGCGKTTILNLLSGVAIPQLGNLINKPNQVSYIFQETRILPWKTVYENVVFPLKTSMSLADRSIQAERFLKHVGLWDQKDVYPNQLSGGMKQRVSIARAFAFPSSVILMDEAFQGLDIVLKEHLLQDFAKSWSDEPRTVVFVTHDLDEAVLLGQEIFILPKAPITSARLIQIDQMPGISRTNREDLKSELKALMTQ